MDFQEYLQAPGVSISRLKGYIKSAAHAAVPKEQTDAMSLGTALHTLILEPHTFDGLYAVAPVCDRRTREGKAIFADFQIKNHGKEFIKAADLETIKAMQAAIIAHKLANGLVNCGPTEKAVFWELDGIACKGRFDVWNSGAGLIVDLKKTRDASPAAFQRQAINLQYHWQAAWYCDGAKAITGKDHTFVFVAVEDTAPYGVACYTAGPQFLTLGREGYQKALQQHLECLESGKFPAYHDGEYILEPPRWAINQTTLEMEDDFNDD